MLLSVSRRIPVTSDIMRIQTDFRGRPIVVDGDLGVLANHRCVLDAHRMHYRTELFSGSVFDWLQTL